MLAQEKSSASHVGEDQSSHAVFAAREAHWKNVLVGLFGAANTLATTYLQEERDSALACIDADHHKSVIDLFNQLARAKALGLSLTGAMKLRIEGQAEVELWSVVNEQFATCSLSDLIAANDWLRPGDVVYKAVTIERHTLTEADFAAATAPAVIGGAA
jgi:hypothetical protein